MSGFPSNGAHRRLSVKVEVVEVDEVANFVNSINFEGFTYQLFLEETRKWEINLQSFFGNIDDEISSKWCWGFIELARLFWQKIKRTLGFKNHPRETQALQL